MPTRHPPRTPLDHVAAQAHRRVDREAPLLLRDVLLEYVRLDRPRKLLGRDRPSAANVGLRGGHEVGEHDRRGRVDRHRHRHPSQVDAGEQRLHVIERVHRHALAPDLAERARVVGVMSHQRGHVKRRRQPRLAVLEQVVEALVGLLAGAEARELAHRPQAPAVHRLVDAAGEGVLARLSDRVLRAARAGARAPGPRGCSTHSPAHRRGCGRHARRRWMGGVRLRRVAVAARLRGARGRLGADCHVASMLLGSARAIAHARRVSGLARVLYARSRMVHERGAITKELGRLIGAEHVLDAPPRSPYNRDSSNRRGIEGHADAVALPGDAREVAAVLALVLRPRPAARAPRRRHGADRRRSAHARRPRALARAPARRARARPGAVAAVRGRRRQHARRAAPGARERPVLRPRPRGLGAVADRGQRRHQRRWPARAEVRRHRRMGGRPGGRAGPRRARARGWLGRQGRRWL